MNVPILIDAHVHLYPQHDATVFLNAAKKHFAAAADEVGARGNAVKVLAMTETAWDTAFADFASGKRVADGWTTQTCPADPAALWLVDDSGTELLMVAGRQIISKEKVEVLALATPLSFTDGLPVADVLVDLHAAKIPAVLPWGMGKWIGKRGTIVQNFLKRKEGCDGVMIGDNAGRPKIWANAHQFLLAAQANVPIAPGSDPLPVPGAEAQAGRYGFAIQGTVDRRTPAIDLAAQLFAMRGQPTVFGTRLGLVAAIQDQIALRRA